MRQYVFSFLTFSFLIFHTNFISAQEELIKTTTVIMDVGSRTLRKLPFIVANDQDIYQKYGLDVVMQLSAPDFPDGIETEKLTRRQRRNIDFKIRSHIPNFMAQITNANTRVEKSIGSTECNSSSQVVGNLNASLPYEFQDKRIGVSNLYSSSHFIAVSLAKRIKLDPVNDISILFGGQTYEQLFNNEVDVIVMDEISAAVAMQNGYSNLIDTSEWSEPITGISILVTEDWLKDSENNDKARNILQAIFESLSIVHKDKRLTQDILTRWYGIKDEKLLDSIYEFAKKLPARPEVCIEGIKSALEIYDSNITRRYKPDDFYDDRFIRELEENESIKAQ